MHPLRIKLPVFVLALTNPSFYVAAIMKSVALGQQAGSTSTRSAGQELVGSTLMGAAIAGCIWFGLSMRPNLWMLMLWMMGSTSPSRPACICRTPSTCGWEHRFSFGPKGLRSQCCTESERRLPRSIPINRRTRRSTTLRLGLCVNLNSRFRG